jgi:hypothetical protein
MLTTADRPNADAVLLSLTTDGPNAFRHSEKSTSRGPCTYLDVRSCARLVCCPPSISMPGQCNAAAAYYAPLLVG